MSKGELHMGRYVYRLGDKSETAIILPIEERPAEPRVVKTTKDGWAWYWLRSQSRTDGIPESEFIEVVW